MIPNRPISVILLCPLLFSCATILNGPAQKIRISAGKNITVLSVDRSIPLDTAVQGMDRVISYIVPRSSRDLVIHMRVDTAKKTFPLRPRNSLAFWYNIFTTYGIGLVVDWNNPKRYSYPAWTRLTTDDTVISRHRYSPIPVHTLRLSLEFAPINGFSVTSPEGQLNTEGMIGLEMGLDYFYRNGRYLSASLGLATSAVPVDYFGKQYIRTATAGYLNVRNNHVLGSFDLGYGLNISDFLWTRTTIGDTVNRNAQKRTAAFGLSLSAQYRIGNYVRVGLLFQPDFFNAGDLPAFKYQQYFAASLCWRIPLH